MSARYVHDYAAFDRLVLAAPFMVAEMRRRAEKVEAHAIAHAPYDAAATDGGHYRDSFSVEAGVRPTSKGRPRAYGRVSNSDAAALYVEFGTVNNPRHRTLGNALDAAKD